MLFTNSSETKAVLSQGDFQVFVLTPTSMETMEEDYAASLGPLKTLLLEDLTSV